MAELIHAVRAYTPRLKRERMASMKEVVNFMAGRTGLNKGAIAMVLYELKDTLAFFHLSGRGVKLEGLGSYAPKIDLDGVITLSHRIDPELKAELNKPNAYEGQMANRDMIGKTSADLVKRWNQENPDDKIKKKKK
ncbi:MAG: hypothetical protein GY950_23240 [bacterium]|nr:hypothetical protein [bacterium]